MEILIDELWKELKGSVSFEELVFLRKCFRAYSSKAHLANVVNDLKIMQRFTPPPQKILDFGCGIGVQSYLLAKLGYNVLGLETTDDKSLDGFLKGKADEHKKTREESMESVWRIIQRKANVEFRFYDGMHIPFADKSFDIVFTYAVIEHIPPDELDNIFNEIRRILRDNGIFYLFQLPQRTSYTEYIARKLGMESHEFLWSYRSIMDLLNRSGFSIMFWERADMLINHPYKIVNPLFPFMKSINKLLLHTPLTKFAHHLTVVSKKI
ncbi:MAG: class I SAM-dependent methyltransferase [candidate division WOR-3 bacterium]